MSTVIAVLATLDTKGEEAKYLAEQMGKLGSRALILDIGVMGEPACEADVTRGEVATAGGTELAVLLAVYCIPHRCDPTGHVFLRHPGAG